MKEYMTWRKYATPVLLIILQYSVKQLPVAQLEFKSRGATILRIADIAEGASPPRYQCLDYSSIHNYTVIRKKCVHAFNFFSIGFDIKI